MASTWQSIAADTCRPIYGFHDVEEGFVWSTHGFGIFFPDAGRKPGAIVLAVHNPHGEITLQCRLGDRWLAVTVPHGEQKIVLAADVIGRFIDFTISPKILLGSDVRELGLMIRRITLDSAADSACLRFQPKSPAEPTIAPTAHDGLDRLRTAAETIGSHAVGGFLREGWFKAGWSDGAFHMQLHAPLWMPLDAEIACDCTINGRDETIAFHRDESRQNRYRAVLPLESITGLATRLIDVDDPIDIEMRPNDIGRYRGQGVHWRGRGADGLPDAANIARVAGPVSVENFLLHGASWYVKLERFAETLLPGGLADAGRIVAWGCGCARIARHAPPEHRPKIMGFDIDPVNIAWCREYVHGMRCEHCSIDPPLPLEEDSVDILFAHSVLTHLGEHHQNRWLAEVRRVLRPGGLAFLTVLAELSWYERFHPHGRTPEAIAEYLEKGFVDHGWQQDVGVDVDCPGAYVQVSHGLGYVRSKWSQLFEIVDWIDGFADLQTLVVVRK